MYRIHHRPRSRHLTRFGLATAAAAALALTPLTGCSSTKASEAKPPAVNHAYHDALASAATAIKLAEFDQADARLAEARTSAQSKRQHTKVSDLQLLSDGSRALMAGNGADAAKAYSKITDNDLREQLKQRLREADLDLPKPRTSSPGNAQLVTR
ncbi:MAG: hypothetical protein AAF710_00095 [Planctomycetota bacterium]